MTGWRYFFLFRRSRGGGAIACVCVCIVLFMDKRSAPSPVSIPLYMCMISNVNTSIQSVAPEPQTWHSCPHIYVRNSFIHYILIDCCHSINYNFFVLIWKDFGSLNIVVENLHYVCMTSINNNIKYLLKLLQAICCCSQM